jgi:hypothetical protein
MRIIGLARIVDFNEDGTCRVRLFDENKLPQGKILTGVKFQSDAQPVTIAETLPELSGHELDTMARQNLFYNSHRRVVIE